MSGKRALIAGALALLTACSSITTHIDYDREVDLDGYHTFAWAPNWETSMEKTSPLMHQRLVDYITQKLREGGMSQVKDGPDLFITYYTSSKKEVKVNTISTEHGYPSDPNSDSYPGDPPWIETTTTVHTYVKGTLILNFWDAATEKLVWRGTAKSVMPENPQKEEKNIYEAIDALAKEWRKMRS